MITPAEENQLHQLKKKSERFDFGKTLHIAQGYRFLIDLCERVIAENAKLTHENGELRAKFPIDARQRR